jgi:hypothetical protein
VFAGLLLASLSVAVAQTALFQRKARAGWLDELDELRARSLDRPDGAIGEVVEGDDIWTDLRDGGQYDDPHEISSLYADDDRKARPVGRATTAAGATAASVSAPPTPAPPAEVTEAPEVDADIWTHSDRAGDPVVAPGASYESDQLWAQPAPHPMRPSEMWHPAELDATSMDDEAWALGAELATQLVDGAPETPVAVPAEVDQAPEAAEAAEPAESLPVTPEVSSHLEAQLLAAADVTVLEPAAAAPASPGPAALAPGPSASWTEPLATAPVGRRHRRDRPVLPGAAPTADAGVVEALPSRGERSPLPEAPLPPAAVPVAPAAIAPAAIAPAASVVPETPEVASAVAEPGEPGELALAPDGLLGVDGTIVRIGGARRAAAASSGDRTTVALDEGWCWVAPGEGMAAAVVIDLSTVELTVEPGATALAVAEVDGSCFIVLADGHGQLRRGDESGALGRGAIVMVDPAGWAQIDQATDEEIVADPIVAENLAADAEL